MLSMLCALAFVIPPVTADIGKYMPTREIFLWNHDIIPDILPYVPAGDIEVWAGWQRIYMGGAIPKEATSWNFRVNFTAVSESFSTVVEVDPISYRCTNFHWVKVNIPGGDMDTGEDAMPRGDPPTGIYVALLVFPQKSQLNANLVKEYFKDDKCQRSANFTSTLQLDNAVAVSAYIVLDKSIKCSNTPFSILGDETPNWTALKENLKKINTTRTGDLWTTPDGVLEVEYVEGVPLRFGNCIPVFLTAYAPKVMRFKSSKGNFYTLVFVDTYSGYPTNWVRVNIPDSDLNGGQDAVPYTGLLEAGGICLFLLFSQGNQKINVSETASITSYTARELSNKFKLGDPVASNFYVSFPGDGLSPEGFPNGTYLQPPHSRAPTAKTTPAAGTRTTTAIVTTAIVTTTRGSAIVAHGAAVCGTVAGLLVLLQVVLP